MREFSKVSPQLWGKRQFKSMSGNARLVMLYFMTSRHQNSAGCYQVPDGYGSSDLGWPTEEYVRARQEVQRSGLVVYDEETSELYLLGWFEENPVTNENHYMGCQRLVEMIESQIVGEAASKELEESFERLQKKPKKGSSSRKNAYDEDRF